MSMSRSRTANTTTTITAGGGGGVRTSNAHHTANNLTAITPSTAATNTSEGKRSNERFLELKESLTNKKFYLVNKIGPTVFNVRDEDGYAFKVTLGCPHTCTCDTSKNHCDAVLCVHKVFCLLKVVRMDETNHMSWRTSMTDAEVENMLNGLYGVPRAIRRVHGSSATVQRVTGGTGLNGEGDPDINKDRRQQVQFNSEDDVCPICQDTFAEEQALTWCRAGCGNNIHAKCMILYVQHNKKSKRSYPGGNQSNSNDNCVLCPLCRCDWGPTAMQQIREDSKVTDAKYSCATVTCKGCKVPLRGTFYRCIECSQGVNYSSPEVDGRGITTSHRENGGYYHDMCQRCYEGAHGEKEHRKHHLLKADASHNLAEHIWEPVVSRASMKKSATTRNEFLRSLQTREIQASDYDMLLALDGHVNTSPPLADFIIDSMRRCMEYKGADSCWCCDQQHDGLPLRVLSCCGNTVHEICLHGRINDEAANSHSNIAKITCPHSSCGKRVFMGLCRSVRKRLHKSSSSSLQKKGEEGVGMNQSPSKLMDSIVSISGIPTHPAALPELNVSSLSVIQPPVSQHAKKTRTRELRGRKKGVKDSRYMLTPLLTVSREAIADGSTAVLVDHEHLNMSLNVGRVKGTESVTQGAQLTAMPPLVSGGSVSSLTMMNAKKRLQKFGMRQQMHMSIHRNDHTNAVLRSNDDNYDGGTLTVRNRMAGGGSMLQQDFGEMTIAGQSTRLHHAGQTFRGTLTR